MMTETEIELVHLCNLLIESSYFAIFIKCIRKNIGFKVFFAKCLITCRALVQISYGSLRKGGRLKIGYEQDIWKLPQMEKSRKSRPSSKKKCQLHLIAFLPLLLISFAILASASEGTAIVNIAEGGADILVGSFLGTAAAIPLQYGGRIPVLLMKFRWRLHMLAVNQESRCYRCFSIVANILFMESLLLFLNWATPGTNNRFSCAHSGSCFQHQPLYLSPSLVSYKKA